MEVADSLAVLALCFASKQVYMADEAEINSFVNTLMKFWIAMKIFAKDIKITGRVKRAKALKSFGVIFDPGL